jgi:hypothetical protein
MRAILAAGFAQSNADVGQPASTAKHSALIEWLLIDRWHAVLREQWIQMGLRRN